MLLLFVNYILRIYYTPHGIRTGHTDTGQYWLSTVSTVFDIGLSALDICRIRTIILLSYWHRAIKITVIYCKIKTNDERLKHMCKTSKEILKLLVF